MFTAIRMTHVIEHLAIFLRFMVQISSGVKLFASSFVKKSLDCMELLICSSCIVSTSVILVTRRLYQREWHYLGKVMDNGKDV